MTGTGQPISGSSGYPADSGRSGGPPESTSVPYLTKRFREIITAAEPLYPGSFGSPAASGQLGGSPESTSVRSAIIRSPDTTMET